MYTPGMNFSVLLLCSVVYCVFRRLKHVGRSPPRSVRFLTLNLRVALGADHHRYQRPVVRGRAVHQIEALTLVMPGYRTEVKILSRGLRKEVYRNSNLRVDIDLLEDPSAFPRVFFRNESGSNGMRAFEGEGAPRKHPVYLTQQIDTLSRVLRTCPMAPFLLTSTLPYN